MGWLKNKREENRLKEEAILHESPIGMTVVRVGRVDYGFQKLVTKWVEAGWEVVDVGPGASKYQKLITFKKIR